MDKQFLCVLIVIVTTSALIEAWVDSREDRRSARESRRGVHYHAKRHMQAGEEPKKRTTTQRSEKRKKPSGHLTPLRADDIDDDEVLSVAIGPPPMRPKFEKNTWKAPAKPTPTPSPFEINGTAVLLIKEVLSQLGQEFLTRQVNEDFIFGQYIGNAMKNLTNDLKLRAQRELLDVIVKYQTSKSSKPDDKIPSLLKTQRSNDTEETWPDFTNLATIVA